jgi:iron complex outermembrane receptor protein
VKYLFLLAIAVATAGAGPLLAAISDDDVEYPLPEIVVTAQPVSASPNLVRSVDQETIISWNAHTAAEALVQVPGVNVQYGGSSGNARIWMRGFRDRDMLVLFDGIPIASAFEGRIDLNEISLEAVSDINVSKSAPSVIYGPNGMGGVVDVVPNPDAWAEAVTASLEFGANDTQSIQAGYSGRSERVAYRLSGSYDHRDAFEVARGFSPDTNQLSAERTNSDYVRRNLFGYIRTESQFFGESSFFYNSSDNERGLPPEVGVDDADFERLSQSHRQTFGVSNRFEQVPVSVKVFHNRYDSELEIYTDDTYRELDEVESAEEISWGAMAYSSFAHGERHLFVVAGTALREEFDSQGALENFDAATLKTFSVAAEDHIALGKLSVVLGGILGRFEQPEVDRSVNVFNPQMTLEWRVSNGLVVHASGAERTRFPKLRELYQRKRGNPDLVEQTAQNFQLGLAYSRGAYWSMDVTLFRSNVDDLIERPDRRSGYQNLAEVQFEGIETAASIRPHDMVFARLAYTYLDAAESAPAGGERQLRSRAKHSVYGELRIDLRDDLRLSLNGIYSDGLYDLDGEQNYIKLPGYFALHAKIAKRFGDKVGVYLSVSNVLDEDYSHRLGFPRPGREAKLGLTLKL